MIFAFLSGLLHTYSSPLYAVPRDRNRCQEVETEALSLIVDQEIQKTIPDSHRTILLLKTQMIP